MLDRAAVLCGNYPSRFRVSGANGRSFFVLLITRAPYHEVNGIESDQVATGNALMAEFRDLR